MKTIIIFFVAYLACGAHAKVFHPIQGSNSLLLSAKSNDFIDDLLDTVENSLIGGGYNDISLPTGGFDFTIKVGIINQRGSVSFSGGSLRGMQTIRRSSEFSIDSLGNGEYRVSGALVIPQASISYTAGASFMGTSPSFTVSGSVTNVRMSLVLRVDSSGGVRVEEFGQSGSYSSNFNVNGLPSLLQPLVDQLTNWVGASTANAITGIIQNTIGSFIGQALADTLFPLP